MSFLDKLKKHMAKPIQLPARQTTEQYAESFQITFEVYLKSKLSALADSLKEIDKAIKDTLPAQVGVVAAQDKFSEVFENEVAYRIDRWVRVDDAFRDRLWREMEAYLKKIKRVRMDMIVKTVLASNNAEVEIHVATAMKYGKEWTERMDAAGIHVKDTMIKRTIKWFAQLTADELTRDYERYFKEHKKNDP